MIEPEEGVDYYIDEWQRYTVCISVEVDGLRDTDGDEIACRAIDQFQDGSIDGEADVVDSQKIRDVELDWNTDLPFNRDAWRKEKCTELGLNEDGKPLRPGDKEQPKDQQRLTSYGVVG